MYFPKYFIVHYCHVVITTILDDFPNHGYCIDKFFSSSDF